MPYTGDPVSVAVEGTDYGSMIMLRNHSGSRRQFRVNDQLHRLDGNTIAGLVVADQPDEVVVTVDGYGQLWPIIREVG